MTCHIIGWTELLSCAYESIDESLYLREVKESYYPIASSALSTNNDNILLVAVTRATV